MSYLKSVSNIFLISLCFVCSGYAAERDITLQWDESIDAPYLQSYKIYYYSTPGDAGSLDTADYAKSYTLVGESPVLINPLSDPKPITINKNNTQITLHFSDNRKDYYFVVTAVDTRGLESLPSNEVISETGSEDGVISASSEGGGGGGCFIATAAFGSYLDPHVKVLRGFRDRYLLTNAPGRAFVNYYYRYSPPAVEVIKKHEALKAAARWALVPVVCGVEHPYMLLVFFIVPAGIVLIFRRRKVKHDES